MSKCRPAIEAIDQFQADIAPSLTDQLQRRWARSGVLLLQGDAAAAATELDAIENLLVQLAEVPSALPANIANMCRFRRMRLDLPIAIGGLTARQWQSVEDMVEAREAQMDERCVLHLVEELEMLLLLAEHMLVSGDRVAEIAQSLRDSFDDEVVWRRCSPDQLARLCELTGLLACEDASSSLVPLLVAAECYQCMGLKDRYVAALRNALAAAAACQDPRMADIAIDLNATGDKSPITLFALATMAGEFVGPKKARAC